MTSRAIRLQCQQTVTASQSALATTTAAATTLVMYVSTHWPMAHGHKPEPTLMAKPQAITRAGRLQCQQTVTASRSAPRITMAVLLTLVMYVSTAGTEPHGHKPEPTSTAKPQLTPRDLRLRCQQTVTTSPSAPNATTATAAWLVMYVSTAGTEPHGHKLGPTSTAKRPRTNRAIRLQCQQTELASLLVPS